MGAPEAWRSAWVWSREGPPVPGSLNRKGGVTQSAIPNEQVLQMPGDLLEHEAERDPLHLCLCTGRMGHLRLPIQASKCFTCLEIYSPGTEGASICHDLRPGRVLMLLFQVSRCSQCLEICLGVKQSVLPPHTCYLHKRVGGSVCQSRQAGALNA